MKLERAMAALEAASARKRVRVAAPGLHTLDSIASS